MGLAPGSTVSFQEAVIRAGNLPRQKVPDAATLRGGESGDWLWRLKLYRTEGQVPGIGWGKHNSLQLLGVPSVGRTVSEDEMEGNTRLGFRVRILALLLISMQVGQPLFTFGPVFNNKLGTVIFFPQPISQAIRSIYEGVSGTLTNLICRFKSNLRLS